MYIFTYVYRSNEGCCTEHNMAGALYNVITGRKKCAAAEGEDCRICV